MTRIKAAGAALAFTATFFVASAVWAAPQIRAPDRTGLSPTMRAAADDDQNIQRRRNHSDFHAQQHMHRGGGGNSK
jgi:hypothetical protein